jgi:DNA-binding winged helix-turn-helix (wHTH) protein/TolB-like protein
MSKGLNNLREFGKFRLDAERKVLSFENETVNLPLKEIELLCVLTNSTELMSKDEIISQVWQDSFVEESNLSRHIYRLRKVFAEYGEPEDLIETVPKRGYRFTGEIKQISDSQDLIIEKHSITRTVIEEIEQSNEPNIKALPPKPQSNRFLIPILACLAILTVGFSYYFYYKNAPTDIKSVKTIAVLPLKTYKENSKDETLPIRITDALITRLGNVENLVVRPTNAILSFTDENRDVVEIGKKLRTESILDGRIQQENDRLRVTLQLINVADGKQLWSGQIDGNSNQILSLQDAIAAKILETLDTNKTYFALTSTPTSNQEAYEAYLQGRYFSTKRTFEGLTKGIEFFKKAIELDPNFAEAYAGLADTEYLFYDSNFIVDKKQIENSKYNLQKALSIKPTLADAFLTIGSIQMNVDWDWENAEKSYKKAIESMPNNSTARLRYGALLLRLTRFDEAQIQATKAIELDPLSLQGNILLGTISLCKKDYEAANMQYKKVLEINSKFGPVHWWLSRSQWLAGKKDEAINEILLALESDSNDEIADKLKRKTTNNLPEEVIRELLYEWRDNPGKTNPHNMAYLSAVLSDRELAIDWLEKSYAEHHPWTTWIKAAPEFESLKNEPRYQDLLKKMNL